MFKFVILLCACIAAASAGYLGAAPIAYSAPLAAAPLAYSAPLRPIAAPAPILRAGLPIAAPAPIFRAGLPIAAPLFRGAYGYSAAGW